MIIPPIKQSKIDNTIEITMKYLRESTDLTLEQRRLFTDFIDTLNLYKSQEYPINSLEEQTKMNNSEKLEIAIQVLQELKEEIIDHQQSNFSNDLTILYLSKFIEQLKEKINFRKEITNGKFNKH